MYELTAFSGMELGFDLLLGMLAVAYLGRLAIESFRSENDFVDNRFIDRLGVEKRSLLNQRVVRRA